MTAQYPQYPPPPPSNNKTLLVIVIALGTVLLLGIIGLSAWFIWGDNDDPTPTPPTSVETPTPAPLPGGEQPTTPTNPGQQQELTDQDFINAVEEYFSQDFPDAELVQLGKDTCAVIDNNGWDYFIDTGIYDIATQLELAPEDYAFISGAAIAVYCPQYAQYIQQ